MFTFCKNLFLLISIFFVFVLLFKPKLFLEQKNNVYAGMDIVFVLDVSKSMLVKDIIIQNKYYSRLDTSKLLIKNFLSERSGDRVGLVVFAKDATSISPLTDDYNLFLTFLDGVDWQNVNEQGTSFVNAINMGFNRLNIEDQNINPKLIVLLSDGGDGGEDLNQLLDISIDNISFVSIGVGSVDGGKIPEGKDFLGNIIYKKHDGQDVVSYFNENELVRISKYLKGKYFFFDNILNNEDFLSSIKGLKLNIIKDVLSSKSKVDATRHFTFIVGFFFVAFVGFLVGEKFFGGKK